MSRINAKGNQDLLAAYEMGYRVTKDGEVTSPSGGTRSVCEHRKGKKGGRTYLSFTVRLLDGKNPATGKRHPPRKIYVHRLHAYQKFGDALFEEGIGVRHLDNNPHNNTWDNLELGTQKENMADCPPDERKARATNATLNHRRFTQEELRAIFLDRIDGMTYKQLAAKYGGRDKNYAYFIGKAEYSQHLRDEFAEELEALKPKKKEPAPCPPVRQQ